jgi:Na+-driven multidrug efflux pump
MWFLMLLSEIIWGKGNGADDALLNSAVEYVKIRAFSLPTSLLLGVLQSALLGAKDSVTPLVAVKISTVVNILGDYLLVKLFGMGLRGASIATLLAQLGMNSFSVNALMEFRVFLFLYYFIISNS